MRCDKCKFWVSPETWEAFTAGMRRCIAVRQRWDIEDEASYLRSETYTKIRCDALRAARAYVEDGSEYHAVLFTGPDFFCALFSSIEEENPL